jgi:UDP-N-acetylmuramate dehydrogenase
MMTAHRIDDLIPHLPPVRGTLEADVSLAPFTWLRVGGPADYLFRPADLDDLAAFLAFLPQDIPVTVIGVGSNLLIRDSGIDGVVIRLGSAFGRINKIDSITLRAGASALDTQVAQLARQSGIAGVEFLRGVPGSMGGAVAMNAGAYGAQIADCLSMVEAVMRDGTIMRLGRDQLIMTYRDGGLPEGAIVTAVELSGYVDEPALIGARMDDIQARRELTQPIRSKTGGSTFRNPPNEKAWELIDRAGCRGLAIGDAQISELHCNFLINHGAARAEDLENLGEEVRRRVFETSGIMLEWEIKRLGRGGVE